MHKLSEAQAVNLPIMHRVRLLRDVTCGGERERFGQMRFATEVLQTAQVPKDIKIVYL